MALVTDWGLPCSTLCSIRATADCKTLSRSRLFCFKEVFTESLLSGGLPILSGSDGAGAGAGAGSGAGAAALASNSASNSWPVSFRPWTQPGARIGREDWVRAGHRPGDGVPGLDPFQGR